MFKSIIVVLGLFAIAQCAFRPADNMFAATTNGEISLTYVPGTGYTAPVDFSKGSRAPTAALIALWSSKTILMEKCLNFKSYDCDQFDFCERNKQSLVPTLFPHFSAKGHLVNTQAYVDYTNFALAKEAPSLIATECEGSFTGPVGTGAWGVVGLGFADGNQKSYLNMASNFGLSFTQGAFRLKFGANTNGKTLVSKIRTDANWRIPTISGLFLGSRKTTFQAKAIFDINSDSIGVPKQLFGQIVGAMNMFEADCDESALTQPVCKFSGNPAKLPTLKFEVDAQTTINITPQIYAQGFANNQFKLGFRALDATLKGTNFVTPEFTGTIIFGANVLQNFYTFFNMNDRSVSLYQ